MASERATLLPTIWVMRTEDGFYPIQPSTRCKPEDHGRINPHVLSIEDADGKVLWVRNDKRH
jgi:hypothetical protein